MLMCAFFDNILTVIPLIFTLQSQSEAHRYSENPRYQTGDSHQTEKLSNTLKPNS